MEQNNLWIGDIIRMKAVERLLPECKGKKLKLLDCGAGFGIYRATVEAKGYEYSAIDIEERAPFPIIKADAKNLPFKNETFDVVLCVDTAEHIDDDFTAIQEMHRVLKEDGILILHTPNEEQTHIMVEPEKNTEHVREGYTKSSLKNLLNIFKLVEIMPTFDAKDCIAWELGYCDLKHKDVFLDKIINFDYNKYKNLGWISFCTK